MRRSRIAVAVEFLRHELRDGERPSAELYARAARERGIGERMLRRASVRLAVERRKVGYQGVWLWRLPDEGTKRTTVLGPRRVRHYADSTGALCFDDNGRFRQGPTPDELSPDSGGPAPWCGRCLRLGAVAEEVA